MSPSLQDWHLSMIYRYDSQKTFVVCTLITTDFPFFLLVAFTHVPQVMSSLDIALAPIKS